MAMDKFGSIPPPAGPALRGPRPPGSFWTVRRYGVAQMVALGLLATGILLLTIGSFSSIFATQPALRLGTNPWIGYQPLTIARDANQFSERVVLVQGRSAATVMEALRIGTIDAAAITLDEAIRIADAGTPISIALVLDISDGADVVLAKDPKVADAGPRGRKVGVETEAVGAYLLHRWLDRLGIPLSAIEVVDVVAAMHQRAFAELGVDFLVTFEPLASNDFAQTAIRVFDSREIPGEIVDVLAVRQDRIAAQRENLQHVVDGWFAGLALLDRRSADSIERIARHQDITPDEVRRMLGRLRFPDRVENARMFRQGDLQHSVEMLRNWLATENPAGRSHHANLDYSTSALGRR
jgi:NitT/TauT family transport system substrate-binding protein